MSDAEEGVASGPLNLERILRDNLIGSFEVPLGNITLTSLTRELNPAGVAMVTKSLKDKGWSSSACPALVVDTESIPPDGVELTPDVVNNLDLKVLDGNHRIAAATTLFGKEYKVPCRIYKEFPPDVMRILGDGESHLLRSCVLSPYTGAVESSPFGQVRSIPRSGTGRIYV